MKSGDRVCFRFRMGDEARRGVLIGVSEAHVSVLGRCLPIADINTDDGVTQVFAHRVWSPNGDPPPHPHPTDLEIKSALRGAA